MTEKPEDDVTRDTWRDLFLRVREGKALDTDWPKMARMAVQMAEHDFELKQTVRAWFALVEEMHDQQGMHTANVGTAADALWLVIEKAISEGILQGERTPRFHFEGVATQALSAAYRVQRVAEPMTQLAMSIIIEPLRAITGAAQCPVNKFWDDEDARKEADRLRDAAPPPLPPRAPVEAKVRPGE